MSGFLRLFWRDDRGAVTVDWVALVAGSVLFGIAVVFAIFDQGVKPTSKAMSATLSATSEKLATPVAFDYDQF